jgi:ABC-type molybdate transport system ATPase subunit
MIYLLRKLRQDIKLLRMEITSPIAYVTHDIREAFALADKILPVVEGKVEKDWIKGMISRESIIGGAQKPVRESYLSWPLERTV